MSRRRAIAATGGGVIAASLLAACGDNKAGEKAEGLVKKPVDATNQAKRGGILKQYNDRDLATFDPMSSGTTGAGRDLAYQRLLRPKAAILQPYTGEVEGDLADSWEVTADKLQITFKLRPNNKFDPREPTNGRMVDATDVVFSWERLGRVGGRRGDIVNAVNPAAPVRSIQATDAQTIVVKLAFPDAGIFELLQSSAAGHLHILPKETDTTADLRGRTRGSGSFYLEYEPSSRLTWKRNPGFFERERPFVDVVERPIITERAAGLAQFRTGNVFSFPVPAENVLLTKQDIPELLMIQGDVSNIGFATMYGWEEAPKSLFRDERVRQAWSMSWNRDLFIDTFFNVSNYTTAGLPVETRWNTSVQVLHDGWWLDPKGKDFGENARYYKHDIAESKKLLAAAGHPNGIDADSHYVISGNFGPQLNPTAEVLLGMAAESGIRLKSAPVNFATEWDPKFRKGHGHYDGLAFIQDAVTGGVRAWLANVYGSTGDQFHGFSPDGRSTFAGDPYLDDLTSKIRQEFDQKRGWALAYELQRYNAKKQYYTLFPGGASGFRLAWPALGNFGVYNGGISELYLWVDDSKQPLRRA